jgi:hypothetical protein
MSDLCHPLWRLLLGGPLVLGRASHPLRLCRHGLCRLQGDDGPRVQTWGFSDSDVGVQAHRVCHWVPGCSPGAP